jgi:hypothetical protein
LEFGTYSSTVTQAGNKFSFASGDVSGFDVEGLDSCTVTEVSTNTSYYTPNGAMKSAIRCSTGNVTISQPQTIKWVLKYKSGSLASPVPN